MKNRKKLLLTALAVLAVVMVTVIRFFPVGFDRLLPFPRDEVKYCYAILVPAHTSDPILQVDIPLDSPEYQGLVEKLDSTSYIWSGPAGSGQRITLDDYIAHLYFRDENGLDSLFGMDFYGPHITVDDHGFTQESAYYPLGGKAFQQEIVDYLMGCYEKFNSNS